MTLLRFDPYRRVRQGFAVVASATAGHRAACRDCRWLSAAHPSPGDAEQAGAEHYLTTHMRSRH